MVTVCYEGTCSDVYSNMWVQMFVKGSYSWPVLTILAFWGLDWTSQLSTIALGMFKKNFMFGIIYWNTKNECPQKFYASWFTSGAKKKLNSWSAKTLHFCMLILIIIKTNQMWNQYTSIYQLDPRQEMNQIVSSLLAQKYVQWIAA